MKKKDIPQDNEGLSEGKLRDLCYAVDENGNYMTAYSTGWTPKNVAMKMAWDVIEKKVEETRKKVLSGKLSQLAYYMEKNIMNLKLLSQYTGIPKRKIRKHMKPKVFEGLDDENLKKYSQTFDISLEELKDIKRIENT